MKTVRITIITVIALSIASMMGCKKSSTRSVASGSSKLSFQLAVKNGTTLATPASDTIPGLVWTAGTADVSKFSFEARRNGVSIEIESNNLTTVNLFGVSPVTTYVTLDTGIYKEIEVTAFLDHSSTDTIPLKLTGTFKTDSGKTVPIQFDLMSDARIKVEEKNIDLNGTATVTALVDIALDKLMNGITAADLDKATLTNGGIVISKTSNSWLYFKILANISGCGHAEWREDHHDHGDD